MKALILIIFASGFVFAGDPRDEASLKSGQSYTVAKASLEKIGYKSAPTNMDVTDAKARKKFSEVTCGVHVVNH